MINNLKFGLMVFLLSFLLLGQQIFAIPAFSRKYKVGCDMCHTVFPQLNSFGRDFKNNGFRSPDEMVSTYKAKSFFDQDLGNVPIDIQGKINQEFYPNHQRIGTETGIGELQLLAGVNLSQKVAFYLHTHIWESGEIGKPLVIELRVNDLFGSNLFNLRAGQFELPLSFSPEINRLMAFDYMIYSQTIGGNSFSIDQPQLGVELSGDLGSDFHYWTGVVNGNGFETDQNTGLYDNNPAKDFYVRIAKNFDESTIGIFGYIGNNSVFPDSTSYNQKDKFIRIGGDINYPIHDYDFRVSFAYGRDDNYDGLSNSTSFYGGFIEGNYFVTDRFVLVGRYDFIHLKDIQAAPDPQSSNNTWAVTPGFQYLILPNVKTGVEYQFRETSSANQALVYLRFTI